MWLRLFGGSKNFLERYLPVINLAHSHLILLPELIDKVSKRKAVVQHSI